MTPKDYVIPDLPFAELLKDSGILVGLTATMRQYFEQANLPEDIQHGIMEEVVRQASHYREMAKELNPVGLIYLYLKMLQTKIESEKNKQLKNTTCRRGCAHCCHMNVDITRDEGKLLVHWARTQGIDIDEEYLRQQVGMDLMQHITSAVSACVFLKNNECSVYDMRPSSCRKYYAMGDPALCADKDEFAKQAILFHGDAEILASALFNTSPVAPMAETLLSLLNPKADETHLIRLPAERAQELCGTPGNQHAD